MTEKIYLNVFTAEYKAAVLELINRLGWEMKKYDKMIEIVIPEKDIPIFNLVFDAI